MALPVQRRAVTTRACPVEVLRDVTSGLGAGHRHLKLPDRLTEMVAVNFVDAGGAYVLEQRPELGEEGWIAAISATAAGTPLSAW